MQGIYLITNLTDGKKYIGQTTDFHRRKIEHFTPSRVEKSTQLIHQRIKIEGKENFSIEFLEEVKNKEDLLSREQYYYDSIKPEYNMVRPGAYPKRNGVSCVKIDMNTLEVLEVFDSMQSAADSIGVCAGDISTACSTLSGICKGFRWRTLDEWEPNWKPKRSRVSGYPVFQIDAKTKEIIREFKTVTEAAKETGIDLSSIAKACRNGKGKPGGFIWKYKE